MLNFIVGEDEKIIRGILNKIITSLMMPLDIEYRISEFASYNREFDHLVNQRLGPKVYILDIEMGFKSGLDAARKIRENDWQSIIIILTAHYELIYEALKNRLMILDFISKFDDYENKIKDTLNLVIKIIYNHELTFNFTFNRITYKIPYDDILYIIKAEGDRTILIKTFNEQYKSKMTLKEAKTKLKSNFVQIHRACMVNLFNVKAVNFKKLIIIFKNNEECNLFSKNYKKEVKAKWK